MSRLMQRGLTHRGLTHRGLTHRGLTHRGRAAAGVMTAAALAALMLPAARAEAATSVGLATAELSSHSAQATEVTYTVGFAATSGLAAGGTITLTGPAGTTFPASGSDWTLADDTSGNNGGSLNFTSSGSTATATLSGLSVSPGDQVTITAAGIGNTATAGSHDLAVSTSADTTVVNVPVTIDAERAVGSVTVQVSSAAVSATGVTYTVGFTATDELWNSDSTITLTAPAGTKFPATTAPNSAYFVNDDGGPSNNCGPSSVSVSGSGNAVTVTCGGAGSKPIPAGNRVTVSITGVTNASTAGSKTLSVATTSDPKTASGSYSLTSQAGLRSVAAPMLTRSSSVAGKTGTTWTFGFTPTQGFYRTQVKLTAPAGTAFPATASDYTPYDDTSGNGPGVSVTSTAPHTVTLELSTQTVTTLTATFPGGTKFQTGTTCDLIRDDTTGDQAVCLTPSVSGDTVSLATSATFGQFTVNAGDYVTVAFYGVTNTAGTGPQSVGLTSSDVSGAVTLPGFTVSPAAPVTTPGVLLSSYAAGATQNGYTVSFIASEGMGTGGYGNVAASSVTITVPGASFPVSNLCDLIFDASNGQPSICPNAPTGAGGDTITVNDLGADIAPGDQVTVFVYGAQNPAATGSTAVTVATSGSNGSAGSAVTLTAATKVTGAVVWLSSPVHGAANVTYTVGFSVANGLSGGNLQVGWSTVTISAPAGTVFPNNGCSGVSVRDDTYWNSACWATTGGGTDALTISTPTAWPKDHVTVIIQGVTNAAAGLRTLHVTTSSDTVLVPVSYRLS
jgi:hypothetical protein